MNGHDRNHDKISGTKYFDMENLLTRSLYKVLNKANHVSENLQYQLPSFSYQRNIEKPPDFTKKARSLGVARPNNHQIVRNGNYSSPDLQMQMRLLAQEICSRIERKYEKKLEDIRDKDRRETDRRLATIRSEFEAKYSAQMSRLEKEKQRHTEELAEKEKHFTTRQELRNAEKESDLDARRRILDNLQAEISLNRTHFEKIKEEFKRKMEFERENLKLERERLMMQEETPKVVILEEKLRSVQKDNEIMRRRIEELENVEKHVAEITRECNMEKERTRSITLRLRESDKRREHQHRELKSLQKLLTKPKKVVKVRADRLSSSDSELSEGELEILNIWQRIRNLDDIAKDLDASIEHFSNGGENSRYFDENIGKYDDFCRALHYSSSESSSSPKTSSPEKKLSEKKLSSVRRSLHAEIEKKQDTHTGSQKSPSPVKTTAPAEFEKAEVQTLSAPRVEPVSSSIVRPIVETENTRELEIPKGIDPVMAEYMSKMMARNAQKATIQEIPKQVEIMMGDEMELEKSQNEPKINDENDDEFW